MMSIIYPSLLPPQPLSPQLQPLLMHAICCSQTHRTPEPMMIPTVETANPNHRPFDSISGSKQNQDMFSVCQGVNVGLNLWWVLLFPMRHTSKRGQHDFYYLVSPCVMAESVWMLNTWRLFPDALWSGTGFRSLSILRMDIHLYVNIHQGGHRRASGTTALRCFLVWHWEKQQGSCSVQT